MLSGADFCPESIASGGICTERISSFPFLEKLFLFEALNMGEFEKNVRSVTSGWVPLHRIIYNRHLNFYVKKIIVSLY